MPVNNGLEDPTQTLSDKDWSTLDDTDEHQCTSQLKKKRHVPCYIIDDAKDLFSDDDISIEENNNTGKE